MYGINYYKDRSPTAPPRLCALKAVISKISLLLWTHRFPIGSWKSPRSHLENFTSLFRWARTATRRGRRRSTRLSVSWTATCRLSSKTFTPDEKTSGRLDVPQCGLTRCLIRKISSSLRSYSYYKGVQ